MKVLISSNWGPYVGTDYTEALGIYDSLEQAESNAGDVAWDCWEGPEPNEDDDFCDEGPDWTVREYHPEDDMFRAGGGSFADDFEHMKC